MYLYIYVHLQVLFEIINIPCTQGDRIHIYIYTNMMRIYWTYFLICCLKPSCICSSSICDGFLDIFRICSINYPHIQMCLFYIRKHFASVSKRFHTYIYIYTYICIHAYTYLYMHNYAHTHIYVYIYIYIYIYKLIKRYIYIYSFFKSGTLNIIITNAKEIILYYNK